MDFFPQQNKYYAGGNSLNQSIRFCQMGHQSAFVGALGTDDAGEQVAALLQAESVDVSHMRRVNGQTASNKIINDDLGERYGIDGAWEGGVYEEFQLERKNNNQFMSVDFLHLKDYELLQKSLRVADIAYFGGTADMINDLARIAKENRGVIVLTLGAEGSIAFEGDQSYRQKALTTDRVIDSTGCGDAFQAAFTASYFNTKDIRASLLAGAELGNKAAMSFGGVPWR
jgi:sugar/nucleoside kinase (ribokinase family)